MISMPTYTQPAVKICFVSLDFEKCRLTDQTCEYSDHFWTCVGRHNGSKIT